jgi:hypothetical protein
VAERLAVDRVAIAQQPAGRRVIRKRLNDLPCGSGGRRMLRDVKVNDPPTVMEKDQTDERIRPVTVGTMKKSIEANAGT